MKKETKKLVENDMLSGSLDLLAGSTPKVSEIKRKGTVSETGSSKSKKQGTEPLNKEQKTTTSKSAKSSIAASDEKLEDLEKINEEGLKNSATRGKRNQLLIIILAVLLVVAIAFVVVSVFMLKADTNCKLNIYGSVKAEYVVEGEEKDELRLRVDMKSNTILELDLNLKIKESGSFMVKYEIICYFKGEKMKDYKVYEPNREVFELKDGYFVSMQPVSGTVALCQGVVINDEFGSLFNGYDFDMEINTYIERA